jgi:hypothetical protein
VTITVREPVLRMLELGPMPSESDATDEQLHMYERHILALTTPASDEEAAALVGILPLSGGSLFGLAWSVLHFI